MNMKLWLVLGVLAAGWTLWSSEAQALEPTFEIAQSPGSGAPPGSGVPGGGVGSGMPAGQRDHGLPSTNNMDSMGKGSGIGALEQGEERRMQSDPGTRRPPGSGSAGSTLGGRGASSPGSPSGSGSAGMGSSGGATSGR